MCVCDSPVPFTSCQDADDRVWREEESSSTGHTRTQVTNTPWRAERNYWKYQLFVNRSDESIDVIKTPKTDIDSARNSLEVDFPTFVFILLNYNSSIDKFLKYYWIIKVLHTIDNKCFVKTNNQRSVYKPLNLYSLNLIIIIFE